MNKLVAVFCLLLAGLGTTFVAHAQSLTQPLDRIVAVVEDEVILQSELDHTVSTPCPVPQ